MLNTRGVREETVQAILRDEVKWDHNGYRQMKCAGGRDQHCLQVLHCGLAAESLLTLQQPTLMYHLL